MADEYENPRVSNPHYVSFLAAVHMDKGLERETDKVLKAAVHIAIDPVTGIRECTVYSDDGFGNGNEIFSFEMKD